MMVQGHGHEAGLHQAHGRRDGAPAIVRQKADPRATIKAMRKKAARHGINRRAQRSIAQRDRTRGITQVDDRGRILRDAGRNDIADPGTRTTLPTTVRPRTSARAPLPRDKGQVPATGGCIAPSSPRATRACRSPAAEPSEPMLVISAEKL